MAPKISLTVNDKKISLLWDVARYFISIFTGIAVFCLLYPYFKDFGLPSAEQFNQLGNFARETGAKRTNNTYLYIIGCLILVGTMLLYRVTLFSRVKSSEKSLLQKEITEMLIGIFVVFSLFFTFAFIATKVIGGREGFEHTPLSIEFIFIGVNLFLCLYFESRWSRMARAAIDGITVLVIFILTIRLDVHYFDFSNFICAANDVMLGKDILANVISQYGFLNVYFFAFVMKIFRLEDPYVALAAVNSLFYFAGFLFLYVFFRRYTSRAVFSSLTVFCIMTINLCLFANVPSHWTPSVGLFRFGAFLPVFYILYSGLWKRKRYGAWLLAVTVVLAFFWVIEVGLYILASLVAVAFLKLIFEDDKEERLKLLRCFLPTAILFCMTIAILTLRILVKYGHGPVWADLIYYQVHYLTSGLGTLPLTNFYLWPLVMLVYSVTLYVCFYFYPRLKHADAWAFLSFFGLQSLLYYISLVIIDHLSRASLSATILLFVMFGFLMQKGIDINFKSRKYELKNIIYLIVVILSLYSGATMEKFADQKPFISFLTEFPRKITKDLQTYSLEKFMAKNRIDEFKYDVLTIQRLIPPQEPAVIISKNDTLFHAFAKRRSLFKIAFYPNFNYSQEAVPEAVRLILDSKIRYLFMDTSDYQCYANRVSSHGIAMREGLDKHFSKVRQLGLLDLYERNSN